MLGDLAWSERRQAKEIARASVAEYIDMGIRLIVVERDEINGRPLVPGNTQPLREVARHERGGIVKIHTAPDGRPTATFVGPSKNPIVWHASRQQAALILHEGDAPWVLITGSEGAGKTACLGMWLAFRALEHIGHVREIGVTAPTGPRIENILKEIRRWWPPRWAQWSERHRRFTFYAGPVVQFVSAVERSKDLGSPVQGNSWVAAASDELQDQFALEPNIEARGRTAPDVWRNGRLVRAWYPRLSTSTFKDTSGWRTFHALCVANMNAANPAERAWFVTKLLGLESPFVSPGHWEKLRTAGTMTPREYQRRVLAMEVGPEAQLYHCWSRKSADGTPGNLRQFPDMNFDDVTAEVLRPYVPPGVNAHVLVGHDPGKRQHVSVYMKAVRFHADVKRGDMRPRWFIVGETTSPDSTIEVHVQEVLKRLRTQWRVNLPPVKGLDGKPRPDPASDRQALVRIDPHDTRGDVHPGRDFYSVWRSFGLIAKAASYDGDKPTPVKVETRINLINTLLCAQTATGEVRRLFIACDEQGKPCTHNPGEPERVVDAFESMERNEAGKAEWENKDRHDKSHWPAAVAYGLMTVERGNVYREASWGANS